MLQLQPNQSLTPLSVGDLLNRYPTLTSIKLARLYQTFIREEQYIPKDSPPYIYNIFSNLGLEIIEITSNVLDSTTSQFVDEIIIAFTSIYSPGQPPTIMFDYANFIADKMHDQFMRLDNERMSTYSLVLYHLFLYYQVDKLPITL